jgi:hypothetical protein
MIQSPESLLESSAVDVTELVFGAVIVWTIVS